MPDIRDKEDIKIFIDAFYARVRKDELLSPIFSQKIKEEEWPQHLERMYSFWNTVLFAQQDYRGNPFSKHATLPIGADHFKQWIKLMHETIDEYFSGEKSEETKTRAVKMGNMFQIKLEHIRSQKNYVNIV